MSCSKKTVVAFLRMNCQCYLIRISISLRNQRTKESLKCRFTSTNVTIVSK
jgi:hypothetical protein